MAIQNELTRLRESLERAERVQTELDWRVFHLKTLYDVSKDIFGNVDLGIILKKFLLITTGNFGVFKGFVLMMDVSCKEVTHFVSVGFKDDDSGVLKKGGSEFLLKGSPQGVVENVVEFKQQGVFPAGVACVLPFTLDADFMGLIGLGARMVDEAYSTDDKGLLVTLANNLVVALRNARSFEEIRCLNLDLQDKNERLENTLNELDRRVYHLKTMYDVSREAFGEIVFGAILKKFLLMTTGNFGAMEGFVSILDVSLAEISHFESTGYEENVLGSLREAARQCLLRGYAEGSSEKPTTFREPIGSGPNAVFAMLFTAWSECVGLVGLGDKLAGDSYSEDDEELLATLVNNLIVALRNARSFEEIKQLNQDLQEKNEELEKTLKELQAAMRKVELLESIKTNLSKFVPTTVTRLIEKSPAASIPEAREQDVSVLFLDIEGYTKISERLGSAELSGLIERYFSVFMDAIYANNGDVNETAGDGLMVLFMSEDQKTNAIEAVRTALAIQEKAVLISQEDKTSPEPLVINMGINSGPALLGAAKFESYAGSRWTYTARGMVTNVAARIGALASDGTIHLSKSTAERVKGYFSISPAGEFALKNVSEQVEVFTLMPCKPAL